MVSSATAERATGRKDPVQLTAVNFSMGEQKMSGMTILCVEDQPDDLAILTAALEGIGYEVMPASNGGQAIDLFTKQAIDGVLLEDNLPDATGTTLRTKLKAIHPDIPVLLFAGVGRQTKFMLRFFDAYLRNTERVGDGLGDLQV